MYISFVVPVLNEQGNVARLHAEIVEAAKALKKPFEVIFVNDGSTDATLAELKKLSPITIVDLRGNYGQTAALSAGIHQAKGEYLATLDGDGQNDPADVPAMLAMLIEKRKDVICGWRKNRQDSFSKRFISQGAKFLRGLFVQDGIHDSGCTLRVYRRECFDDLVLRGEMHRFIPALLRWRGFNLAEMSVHHRPRGTGQTKYTWKRTVKGFLDMFNLWFFHKFASRPFHLLGTVGAGTFGLGVVSLLALAVARVLGRISLSDSIWPLVAVFLVLFGFQMVVSGLIMDLIINSSEKKKYYAVKNIFTNG